MSDLEASLARLEATREAKRREREALWARIKVEEPEMAADIEALARRMQATVARYETQEGERLINKEAAVQYDKDLAAEAARVAKNEADLAALLADPVIRRRYGG